MSSTDEPVYNHNTTDTASNRLPSLPTEQNDFQPDGQGMDFGLLLACH